MNKSSGTVASSATRAGIEDGGTWARKQARIMTGTWFAASRVSCWQRVCLFHGTYHAEWDPRAVLPEAQLQFSLGLRVDSHSWSPTPDSEFDLSSDIRSQGPGLNHL